MARERLTQKIPLLAGWLLLALWVGWWTANLATNHLVGGSKTWVPRYPTLGVDFLHNHEGVRLWLQGDDPYRVVLNSGEQAEPFSYPPLVLRVFAWTAWLSPHAALTGWTVALTLCAAFGAWTCWKTRGELGLHRLPFPLVLGFILWSTPIVYALERGNYDLLVLLLLVAVAWLLRRSTAWADWSAGICLAAAAGLKVYPALGGLVFLVLRRPQAILGAVLAGVGLVLLDVPGTMQFLENARTVFGRHVPTAHGKLHETMHTLSGAWALLWKGTPFDGLALLPGQVVWAVLMLPPLGWVSVRLARCPEPQQLLLPYLLWVTSVATFLPSVSNDYNLFVLPLAALAVWDRRDPLLVHLLLGLLVLWWQPFLLPTGPRVLFACKLAGVFAVAGSLVQRTRGFAAASDRPGAGREWSHDRHQAGRSPAKDLLLRDDAAA